jgi:cytochrome bd-type quinol oxidase subunit 2
VTLIRSRTLKATVRPTTRSSSVDLRRNPPRAERRYHHWWDRAVFWGASVAAFAQGCILAGILRGVKVRDDEFAGGIFDWLTPFSLFCGAGLSLVTRCSALAGSTSRPRELCKTGVDATPRDLFSLS